MEMYGARSASWPQKSIILAAEVALIGVSYGVLFGDWLQGIRAFGEAPSLPRNVALFTFNIIVFTRFLLTLFVFLRRQIPWEEAFSVPAAFGLYLLGFPLLAMPASVVWGFWETLGVVLFGVGSFINSYSEYQRHRFKLRKENDGKIYTGGLFRYSMHINYFGDLLWVAGYACLTHNTWSALVPAVLFCFFQFYNVPKLDAYLRERYGEAFANYERRTKRLVPFVL